MYSPTLSFWTQWRYHNKIYLTSSSCHKNQMLKRWWELQSCLLHSRPLEHRHSTSKTGNPYQAFLQWVELSIQFQNGILNFRSLWQTWDSIWESAAWFNLTHLLAMVKVVWSRKVCSIWSHPQLFKITVLQVLFWSFILYFFFSSLSHIHTYWVKWVNRVFFNYLMAHGMDWKWVKFFSFARRYIQLGSCKL